MQEVEESTRHLVFFHLCTNYDMQVYKLVSNYIVSEYEDKQLTRQNVRNMTSF
jgi:hypothetical protein